MPKTSFLLPLLVALVACPALLASSPDADLPVAARAARGAFDPDARQILRDSGLWTEVGAELVDQGGGAHASEDAAAARLLAYGRATEAAADDTRMLQALATLDGQGFFRLALPRALQALRKGREVPPPAPDDPASRGLDLEVFPSSDWAEDVSPDESTEFQAMAREIQRIQDVLAESEGTEPLRGFHAKSHGNLRGHLEVREDLPAELRHGVFEPGRRYPLSARFSNGVGIEDHDWKPDVRGLAIKLEGVEGDMLEGSAPGTQDFLATNQPASLARDARQFMTFARANTNVLKLPVVLIRELGVKEGARILKVLASFALQRTRSVAASTYWTGARSFGPWAARIVFAPSGEVTAPRRKLASSYLREEFRDRISRAEIRFDVFAHLYVNDRDTPIEDGATPWSETASPPVKLGEVVLPRTDLATAEAAAASAEIEAMAFNPWNGVSDHRPLGHLMRARAAVYRSSARHRGADLEGAVD